MCGICGVLSLDGAGVDRRVLDSMNETLVHRGPDSGGVFVNGRVGLAARRLAIIDLAGGDQPIANEDGSIADCNDSGARRTATLLSTVPDALVLTLGNSAYQRGQPSESIRTATTRPGAWRKRGHAQWSGATTCSRFPVARRPERVT
jgi:hypothetical protein